MRPEIRCSIDAIDSSSVEADEKKDISMRLKSKTGFFMVSVFYRKASLRCGVLLGKQYYSTVKMRTVLNMFNEQRYLVGYMPS